MDSRKLATRGERERRAISSPSKQSAPDHASRYLYAGWLFVEAHAKRDFKLRFCVLDDSCFQVYRCEIDLPSRDTEEVRALLITELHVEHVERLHRLNRGILLIGRDGVGLWIHGTHDDSYFEHWLAILADVVASESVRLSISRFGYVHQSSTCSSGSVSASKTAWLKVRQGYFGGWLYGPARRMYCVLSGRCLSVFALNMEGRWAVACGKVTKVSTSASKMWLQVELHDRTRLLIAGRHISVTKKWECYIDAAIGHKTAAPHRISKPVVSPPRRILTY